MKLTIGFCKHPLRAALRCRNLCRVKHELGLYLQELRAVGWIESEVAIFAESSMNSD